MLVSFLIFSVAVISSQIRADDSSEEEERVLHECTKKSGVTIEEIKNFRTDKVSEKMMCFMKCTYEEHGIIDEKGELVKEIIQDKYEDLHLKEEEKKQMDECIDKMKPVKKCTDLDGFFKCIPVMNFSES